MTTFLSSLGSLSDLSNYFTTNWGNYASTGQLPAQDWNCSWQTPDWNTCLVTSWQWPVALSFIMFFWGVTVQSIQHWSFYATVGAPEVHESFFNGIHNVFTAWYTVDSQVNAFITFWETVEGSLLWLTFAGSMFYFNYTQTSNFAFYAGIINIISAYVNVANLATIMTYAVINSVYIQTRYDPTTYSTILFPTFFNGFGISGDNGWLQALVYIEQLLVGNKRLALYNNMMMATTLLLHPISLPFAFYFIGQLPFQFVLDLFVYPVFPQFDTPQVPWHEYFN